MHAEAWGTSTDTVWNRLVCERAWLTRGQRPLWLDSVINKCPRLHLCHSSRLITTKGFPIWQGTLSRHYEAEHCPVTWRHGRHALEEENEHDRLMLLLEHTTKTVSPCQHGIDSGARRVRVGKWRKGLFAAKWSSTASTPGPIRAQNRSVNRRK